jgi:hypothetical protein
MAGRSRWLAIVPALVFLASVLVQVGLPGIYMDGANPDFMAAQWLHRADNPGAGLPSKVFPILGSLYHGLQNAYLGVPVFGVFGYSVATLRIEQAIFGVILLVAFQFLVARLTRSLRVGLVAALCLATELAFGASFRTQFYIVMGGAAWLFVSLLLALPADETSWITKRRVFWSGVFSGLAGYGYFVLWFFVPATLAFATCKRPWREVRAWLAGAAVGVSPFVLGYLSLFVKKHGLEGTLAFLHGMLGQLKPFEGAGGDGHLWHALTLASLAVTDAGNESMVFGRPLGGAWASAKCVLLILGTIAALGVGISRWRRPGEVAPLALLACLPVSFIVLASFFGTRLWAHHFCVLVPFVYLLPAVAIGRNASRAVAVVAVLVLAGNVVQQAGFHRELARTGGVGRMTDALNTMAIEARGEDGRVAYIFPEWGFFTSFSFFTGNRVAYALDTEPSTLDKLVRNGHDQWRIVYWDASQAGRYEALLRARGAAHVALRAFQTRDGKPAFYMLRVVD